MKQIEVMDWTENANGQESKINTIKMLTALINKASKEDMPQGLDQFRMFNRISKAFDHYEAHKEEKSFVELEESDYSFIKRLVDNKIPAEWGSNASIFEAIEKVLNPR